MQVQVQVQEGDTEGRIHYEGMIHFGGGGDNIYTIKYVFSSYSVDAEIGLLKLMELVRSLVETARCLERILGNSPIISCIICCLESD